jgi:hypothetical protein
VVWVDGSEFGDIGKNNFGVVMAEVEAGGDWVQLDLSGSARGGQVIAQQSRGTQEEEDGKEGLDQLQGFRYVVEKYRDVA